MAEQTDADAEEDNVTELIEHELPHDATDLPPIDFSTFLVSLRTSAMIHLGFGGTGDDALDLALARQEVDLLGLLEEKTRGNLTGDEELLMSQILFDLRTRFIAAKARVAK